MVQYDGYFLEYDSDRAGGFEPLRFLPAGDKTVVLGLVTTKTGQLENPDDITRRIDEATAYAPLEQAGAEPAVRVRLDRRGQRAVRGRAVGQDPLGGRHRGGCLALIARTARGWIS
ncbi:hypothetical protein [Microbacterium elymi]|uniref:Uncharacterized protein n=1 Tax=Microbacterium elymi TaxID=2909587 RepID=A0ABY5NL38_9MICO|nr:hypothetical protein [Microbacterium elymi]UUT35786.1 hypothetical protein L2X98_21540 [Microbacterium elymi]